MANCWSRLGGKAADRSFSPLDGLIQRTVSFVIIATCLSLSACVGSDDEAAETPEMQVLTTEGPVLGVKRAGVEQFLGIPYAAPPIGDLRWRPPQPAAMRSTVYPAGTFGATCAQGFTLGVFAAVSSAEDCLYVNIYTPGHKHRALPVMVWIHGGGNFDGAGSDYDGTQIAGDGNSVVVTFNYRLNIFGFFAHPALDSEHHAFANYGIMDQQALLHWVRNNISAFGGDPANVTVFGESAGGANAIAHLVSPGSAGLFRRVIVQSGAYPLSSVTPNLAVAELLGKAAADAAGCQIQTSDCLRHLTVAQLLAVGSVFGLNGIVDGIVIPLPFKDAIKSGQFNRVPIINGANKDEYRFFINLPPVSTNVEPGTYAARVTAQFGANAPLILARYPLANFESETIALATVIGDQYFICPAQRFDIMASKYVSVYSFEFADRTAPSYAPAQAFPYGAAHTLEIPYLFPGFHGGGGTPQTLSPAQKQLSAAIVGYWTNFAHAGSPNGNGLPMWPSFTAAGESTQSFVSPTPTTISSRGVDHQCDLWESLAE